MCGTGGDGADTFNISTVASFVVAATGVPVAKHGNRSVSSRCGSADVLSALGLPHDLPPAMVQACLKDCSVGFMFAPVFHRSMRNVMVPRREVGIRTFFNLLGPMTNPAAVKRQVLGVFDLRWTEPLARTLLELGVEHALVVASHDGTDEISVQGPTQASEVRGGQVRTYTIDPAALGLEPGPPDAIDGGEPAENAARLEGVLRGHDDPAAGAIAANAGAALYVAGVADSKKI